MLFKISTYDDEPTECFGFRGVGFKEPLFLADIFFVSNKAVSGTVFNLYGPLIIHSVPWNDLRTRSREVEYG